MLHFLKDHWPWALALWGGASLFVGLVFGAAALSTDQEPDEWDDPEKWGEQ